MAPYFQTPDEQANLPTRAYRGTLLAIFVASSFSAAAQTPSASDDRKGEREAMVMQQLIKRGTVSSGRGISSADASSGQDMSSLATRRVEDLSRIRNQKVLDAMSSVPRHLFVPAALQREAYADRPLPIGYGQTISQPYIVALMTELLDPKEGSRILEIGTGSGYQAAILTKFTPHVYTIEIVEPLHKQALPRLKQFALEADHVLHGDGYFGLEKAAPFDGIIVTAAADHIPPPLIQQLRPGGRMVVPIGPVHATQRLVVVEKDEAGKVRTRSELPVRFVPLLGGPSQTGARK